MLVRITNSSIAVVGYCAVLFSIILYKMIIKDLPTFLLLISIIPFAYINFKFSRYFGYIVVQNIPLYFLLILAITQFFYSKTNLRISVPYIMLPVIIYSAYSVLLALYGISKGAQLGILVE